MVRSFEEEVKALEDYGHDCCARIDDYIHECCKRIREAHESEVGGYQLALRWKESCDGVDAGGRDEAGSVCTDAPSHQCGCSGCCGGLAEEVAPITTELRNSMRIYGRFSIDDGKKHVELDVETFGQLCDAIDAVHANLEHDVEMWRDRAEDMRMERDDALKEHHAWAPESHYMMLPKDSDGIPVHIGDVMEWPDTSTAEVVGVYENGFFYVEGEDDIAAEWTTAYNKIHHAHETVEDVLREFALAVCKDDALTIRKGVVEEFAKRLTLAGDAE